MMIAKKEGASSRSGGLMRGEPFVFYSRLNLLELTGRKASDAAELLEGIKEVPDAVIYHHTHRYLEQHRYLSPEPPNDFAYWVIHTLGDEFLGERLASLDICQFSSVSALRQALVRCFDGATRTNGNTRRASPGYEFQFIKALTFVIPTGHVAHDLAEFLRGVEQVTVHSLYYHIFEARLRLQKGTNDFSHWLEESLGEKELAGQIARLDPYTHTMEGLRQKICEFIRKSPGN